MKVIAKQLKMYDGVPIRLSEEDAIRLPSKHRIALSTITAGTSETHRL
jgi:hypothetical protein